MVIVAWQLGLGNQLRLISPQTHEAVHIKKKKEEDEGE